MGVKNMSPLGRGLKALLPVSSENSGLSLAGSESVPSSPYFLCPVAFVVPNPYQPRKSFDDAELEGLTASIREKGVLQPLVVRKVSDNRYELIAGERRLRASKKAGLEKVPVLIKDIAMSDRLELALIENIQRENLNPLEEAEAYAQLVNEFSLTQECVAKRVGKNRSTVANCIRILQLPQFALDSLGEGRITSGHARVLLGLPSDEAVRELHDAIVRNNLSVRETEALAKKSKGGGSGKPKKSVASPGLSGSYCSSLSNSLTSFLGAKSKIVQNGARGKIEVEYYSSDDLERLLGLIIQEQ